MLDKAVRSTNFTDAIEELMICFAKAVPTLVFDEARLRQAFKDGEGLWRYRWSTRKPVHWLPMDATFAKYVVEEDQILIGDNLIFQAAFQKDLRGSIEFLLLMKGLHEHAHA
jgi:hypothetical protein